MRLLSSDPSTTRRPPGQPRPPIRAGCGPGCAGSSAPVRGHTGGDLGPVQNQTVTTPLRKGFPAFRAPAIRMLSRNLNAARGTKPNHLSRRLAHGFSLQMRVRLAAPAAPVNTPEFASTQDTSAVLCARSCRVSAQRLTSLATAIGPDTREGGELGSAASGQYTSNTITRRHPTRTA